MNRIARMLASLAVVVLLALAIRGFGCRAPRPPAEPAVADTAVAGMRSATLWFAAPGGDSLVAEARDMEEHEGLHDRVATLVAALERGPARGGLATLPAGTALLHVYLDDRGVLTLDLSRAFRQGFRGGSRAEELAIGSLLRTMASELPDVRQVRLACAGVPLTTLGGHFALDRPLDPDDWP